jgi:hypothetical protein
MLPFCQPDQYRYYFVKHKLEIYHLKLSGKGDFTAYSPKQSLLQNVKVGCTF